METTFGKHSVRAIFLARPESIKRIILLGGKTEAPEEFIELANKHGIKPEILPWEQFLKATDLSPEDKHQGVVTISMPKNTLVENDLKNLENAKVVLALDQINNPHNLGTIIRSAAFFGVDAILLLKNRSADITPTVSRVAVGGTEFIDVYKITNLGRSLKKLKDMGFWVYGLDERGENTLAETDFPEKTCMVVGAEGEGLREKTIKTCDVLVKIPGGRQGLESLNAGVAVAISMYELKR